MVEPDEQDSKKLRIEPEEEMTTPQVGEIPDIVRALTPLPQKSRLSLEISPPKKKSPGGHISYCCHHPDCLAGTKIYECVECGRTFTHPPAYAQHK